MKDRLKRLFATAFTHLSWWKRRLFQLALVLLVVGGAAQVWAYTRGEAAAEGWSWSALRSGFGCLAGFLVGALLRLLSKLGLLLAGVVAAGLMGLAWLGWIDLPWSSVGEATSALGDLVARQTASLERFFAGVLPSGAMGGLGFFGGVTQRPRFGDDD